MATSESHILDAIRLAADLEEMRPARNVTYILNLSRLPNGWGWSINQTAGFPDAFTAYIHYPGFVDVDEPISLCEFAYGRSPQEAFDLALDKALVSGPEVTDRDPNGDRAGYAREGMAS